MAHTTCLLVLLVTAAKIYIEEQAVAGTKQSSQADKGSGLLAMFLAHLPCFVRPANASKLTFNNLYTLDNYATVISTYIFMKLVSKTVRLTSLGRLE
jgi:hypothetical protein